MICLPYSLKEQLEKLLKKGNVLPEQAELMVNVYDRYTVFGSRGYVSGHTINWISDNEYLDHFKEINRFFELKIENQELREENNKLKEFKTKISEAKIALKELDGEVP